MSLWDSVPDEDTSGYATPGQTEITFDLAAPAVAERPEASSYVEISVACEGLPNRDFTTLSDPFAILAQKVANGGYAERGRTEVVDDDLNPKFVQKFKFEADEIDIDYELTFMDYDEHKGDDFLGLCRFNLRDLLATRSSKISFCLVNRKGKAHSRNGSLHLYPERLLRHEKEYKAAMEFGLGIDCRCTSKKNIFFTLSRSTADGHDYVRIYRSAPMRPTNISEGGFAFPPFQVDSSTLTAQDPLRSLLLEVFLEGRTAPKHVSVGEVTFKVGKLDNIKAGEAVPFFSGAAANSSLGRPRLVFPSMNGMVGSYTGVVVMRASNLWIK